MKNDRVYLLEIQERIRRINEFVADGESAFQNSLLIQDAVIRNFEVIGQAVKDISSGLRQAHPEVPWKRIAGFRDVLSHGYLSVTLDEVWKTIVQSLPPFRQQIDSILKAIPEDDDG